MSAPAAAGCTGKVPHVSAGDAHRAIERQNGRWPARVARKGYRVHVYRCPECGHFHLGAEVRR